jgi:tetratricopeptide (TPR) repeat protein
MPSHNILFSAVKLFAGNSGCRYRPRFPFMAAAFLLGSTALAARQSADVSNGGVPLYGNLGPHTRAITTTSTVAQAYFNQGMQFMYAFGTSSALQSFGEAARHDSTCAMCYWGEAWALSPYLNGGMSLTAEGQAYVAIHKAKGLSQHATDVERALIDAMVVRFAEHPVAERRKPLDSLYARAMRDVQRKFPHDLDVVTLYGESLMLLRPRRGRVDLDDPAVREIIPVFEGALARDIRHPGACHLFVHLMEASPEPERAEACADYLGDAIPGASHIRHMPSHIYMNVGRYSDAVRANQNAWHVDQQAAHGGPPGIYPTHNLHMLLFAATLDGQSAVAIQAARDLARIAGDYAFYVPVVLATFGRWDDVLALDEVHDAPFAEGMSRFARGLAHLRTGATAAAKTDLWLIRAIIADLPDSLQFRFHPQRTLLQIPAGILDAEIALVEGRGKEAVKAAERAVEVEDGLVYDEPEPWHLPVRHVLGAVLLELGKADDAARVYREALADHPNNGWALFGLEQALRRLGREDEANRVHDEYERCWSHRDIWLRSSRF